MKRIQLWAPNCRFVEMEMNNQRQILRPSEGGWWESSDTMLAHHDTYAFYLDGSGPYPDPRSPYQPQGILGASQWVDQDRFEWKDREWKPPELESAIFYEIHVGTFSEKGTFEGIIPHLDHLVDLGITHLEIMPVAEFSGNRGWGYDGVNLYAPHHAYGGPEGLKRLVDACHQKGLAIVLDVVYNHLGPVGNHLERFGPYFTVHHATPWGKAVNFDSAYSDEVRAFFIDNALMWLRDYHFDGLRLDAIHAIVDTSARHFLEELTERVADLGKELHRSMFVIAESDLNDGRIVRPVALGGYGLDAQWSEDYHHALHAYLTGERRGYYTDFGNLTHVAKALCQGVVYDGCYSEYRHRRHGRYYADIDARRYVSYLQNHDQIGNRALGERLGHLIPRDRLMVGIALLMTSPFLPLIFQGEEWGASSPFLYFTNHEDAELGTAVFNGRRKEFAHFIREEHVIADPQEERTFLESKLKWNEMQKSEHREIYEWFKRLIHLRRTLPDLKKASFENLEVEFDEVNQWLILRRGAIKVVCNFSENEQVIPVDYSEILLQSKPGTGMSGNSVKICR